MCTRRTWRLALAAAILPTLSYAAGFGDPLPGLTPEQQTAFQDGKTAFVAVEDATWGRSSTRTRAPPATSAPLEPRRRAPWEAPPSASKRGSASRSTMPSRSEEHTSELQSLAYLVCRLLLEKKKKKKKTRRKRMYRRIPH